MDAEAQDKVALSGDGTIRGDGHPLKELGGGGPCTVQVPAG